jgi:transketolase
MTPFTASQVRRVILQQAKRARVGHIGSALSIADLVTVLYHDLLRIPDPEAPERDRFILSKGHAVLALYAALYLRGWMDADTLNTYCGDGTYVGVHPEHELRGIDFSTGSLGQGLSMGAGAALAARLGGSPRRVFVLLSDGECNEGSVWEAAMFAAQQRLSNLMAIVDVNGQQAFGYTKDVLDLSNLRARWNAFGWDVQEVDGHDCEKLAASIRALDTESGPPHVLLALTTFGKGVSFMQNKIEWHYLPMSDEQYAQALLELDDQA